MQQQPGHGLRSFVQRPAGKAVLIAIGLLVVVASFVYVSEILAIPAMLVMGLALPIYVGLKRPRYLAVSGLVIILLTAPFSNLPITQLIRTPIAASTSDAAVPTENGPVAVAAIGAFDTVLVANYAGDSVSVVNATTNTLTRTVPVGSLPTAIAYAPSGTAYVPNLASNTVSVLPFGSARPSATVVVGTDPIAIAFDPVDGDVYVANFNSSNVTVFAASNNSVVATVTVGSQPDAAVVDPGTGDVFVANRGSNSVSVISASTHGVAATVHVGSEPWALAANPNGSEVFVANSGSDNVSVIDGSTHSVSATVRVGTTPEGILAATAPADVFVSNLYSNNVTVISQVAPHRIASVPVGPQPVALAIDAAQSALYVANTGSTNVTVVSTSTLRSVANVTAGTGPSAIAVDPVNGDVYVAALTGQQVAVVRALTNAVLTTIPDGAVGSILQAALVDPFTGLTSTEFNFTVTIDPRYLPMNTTRILSLSLFVSTCPGATSNATPSYCTSGFPLLMREKNFSSPLTSVTNVSFLLQIPSNGIWDWQMDLAFASATPAPSFTPSAYLAYLFLVGDTTGGGIQGPIVGDFAATYFLVLPQIYLDAGLFLGVPFYLLLIVYMYLKSRERRRMDAQRRAAGPIPPATGAPPSGADASGAQPPLTSAPATGRSGPPPKPSSPASAEASCPQCGAVVYEGETRCWKCGANIGEKPSPGGVSPPAPRSGSD